MRILLPLLALLLNAGAWAAEALLQARFRFRMETSQ